MDSFHRELGKIMWDYCGMARNEAGLQRGAGADSRAARGVLEQRQRPGQRAELNQALEKAGRVADFLELGELMCLDALHREESCGGHFREEYQTRTAKRCATTSTSPTSAAWEYAGDGDAAAPATRSRWRSRTCTLAQRSYK